MPGAPTPGTPYPRTAGLGAGRGSIFAPSVILRGPARDYHAMSIRFSL